MTPAPNPPPRGGAEPRVSAERAALLRRSIAKRGLGSFEAYRSVVIELLDDADDLRAKLEAAEARAHKAEQDQARFSVNANARLSEAEAALREMTEQRDGAWKAGRSAALAKIHEIFDGWVKAGMTGDATSSLLQAWQDVRALAPPAETAAKEERT